MHFSASVPILYVDDDEIDRRNLRRSMAKLGLTNPLYEAVDGVEALEVLSDRALRPCIVLLDLNMPRMSGIEFLRQVRSDPALRDVVIFVLTTSDLDGDVAQAYQSQVAGYLTKPIDAGGLTTAVADLSELWKRMLFPGAQG